MKVALAATAFNSIPDNHYCRAYCELEGKWVFFFLFYSSHLHIIQLIVFTLVIRILWVSFSLKVYLTIHILFLLENKNLDNMQFLSFTRIEQENVKRRRQRRKEGRL